MPTKAVGGTRIAATSIPTAAPDTRLSLSGWERLMAAANPEIRGRKIANWKHGLPESSGAYRFLKKKST